MNALHYHILTCRLLKLSAIRVQINQHITNNQNTRPALVDNSKTASNARENSESQKLFKIQNKQLLLNKYLSPQKTVS